MAITTTSDLTAGLLQKIQDDYIFAASGAEIWGQFVQFKPVPFDGGGASAYRQTVLHELEVATTALSENTDVTPTTLADSSFDVTPAFYGNAIALSLAVRYETHPDAYAGAGKTVGMNRAATIDRIIRNGVVGATMVLRVNDLTARTDLDATSDLPTYAWLDDLVSYAKGHHEFEPYEGDTYVSVVHPKLGNAIRALTGWLNPGYYRTDQEGLFTGELGKLAGIRFVESRRGKLYLGGGTTAQAATTLSAASAAGATTLSVASATGLAAPNYITVGTLESSTAEQVQITAVSGSDLTVRGIGNTTSNLDRKSVV